MRILLSFLFTVIFLNASPATCQNLKRITLEDAIHLAKKNSLEYKIAVNTTLSGYWNFQAFKSSFLPKLTLNSTLPEYYRSINRITLPNGQYNFIRQNVSTSRLGFDLSQNIGLTGGRISMSTSLERIDNFGSLNQTSYTSVPLSFNYYQNSLLYNDVKWQKKIAPLRFVESQRDFVEKMEEISRNTTSQYFDLLNAEVQLKLDQQNLKNIDTLVKVSNSRFEIGTIQLNDMLQARVSLLNASKALVNSQLNYEVARQGLVRYLNLDRDEQVEVVLPEDIKNFEVEPQIALEYAKNNRKSFIEFQRRKLEAEQNVARTKSETGPEINIRTNLGFSQRGNNFNSAYSGLLGSQVLEVGLSIPLIDWGVNRSNRKRAEANLDLEINNIDQQTLGIEQEIYLQIMRWNMLQDQMEIARETSGLAQQRYDIARQKYGLGTLSFTDFANAQLEKDRAILDYSNNLRNYWSLYYLIRRLTLYDFENKKKIDTADLPSN